MLIQKSSFNSSGQVLFETMVALAIAVVVLTAIVTAIVVAVANSTFIRSQNLSNKHAQEATEYIRNLKESNDFFQYNPGPPRKFDGMDGTHCLGDDKVFYQCPGQVNVGGAFMRSVEFQGSDNSCRCPVGGGPSSQSINFDSPPPPIPPGSAFSPPNNQYPTGVVDWGTSVWQLSGPFEQFTTNSVAFNGLGPTSASFSFLSSRRLTSVEAYNGGGGASTVTIFCGTNPIKSVDVSAGEKVIIPTEFNSVCSNLQPVTITSTNGWETNFDNLVHDDGTNPPGSQCKARRVTARVKWSSGRCPSSDRFCHKSEVSSCMISQAANL